MKTNISESTLGGLMSPRDKALRTDVRKKEAAKLEKLKLQQQAKRAAAQAKPSAGACMPALPLPAFLSATCLPE